MNLTELDLPITDPTWIFLIVLSIILFAPVLFKKFHIPNIIGMMLAGIIIGEHGLNILARDSSFELFGNVGLYYIMFLAGLEINMGEFKKNRGKTVVLGLLTFSIPMILGLAVNMSLLGYGIATAVLLASMYASHTLISYPIVLRLGVSRQRSVSIAVGATAITDTLTLLVLAIISGMYQGGTGDLFWIKMVLKILAVGGIIIYFTPKLARWFFRKYDDTIMQFIFVLVLLFLAAGLMEIAGMEGILGAFLSGLLLNRLIPSISPLKNHIEFVGNALFIPYFLIGVGMLIDIRVIFGETSVIRTATVMTATAVAGKWVASWITQKTYRMSGTERQLMFGLSNARAAATLAAVLVGYNIILPDGSRLLDENILNGTFLLILITCIISSVMTERAARRIALEEPSDDRDDDSTDEKILIPVANPDTVKDLVCLSLSIRNPRLKDNLYALSIINDNDTGSTRRQSGLQNLENAARIAASANAGLKKISRYDLNIASGITHTVKEQDITTVIIGLRRDSGIKSPILGDLAVNLMRGLNCEIMVTRMAIPINTISRIIITVPPKAEYEAGFDRWVGHFCRMGLSLERSVDFYASESTIARLKSSVAKNYEALPATYTVMNGYGDITSLAGRAGKDCLIAVVSARQGSISYDSSFEKLPKILGRDFPESNLILLYPKKYDDSTYGLNLD